MWIEKLLVAVSMVFLLGTAVESSVDGYDNNAIMHSWVDGLVAETN